jgi:hypothetical protein
MKDTRFDKISKTIAFPKAMHSEIEALAGRDHRSFSAEVVAILEIAIKKEAPHVSAQPDR